MAELWAMPEDTNQLEQVLDFTTYQLKARETAIYPSIGGGEIYPVLELCNEAGEVAGKIKKIWRDKNGAYDTAALDSISDELGDVLWALSQTASELGLSLEAIAAGNLRKLASRKERGVLGGSGDAR